MMAFQITEDQRFYLEQALNGALDQAVGGYHYTYKVYLSMYERRWIERNRENGEWEITDLGRTVARQLGISAYAKDEQP